MTCSETAVRVDTGMERTLRSSAKQELEEEVALEKAEEQLMDEDEEIESCDESGKPVVDAEKLERRMMTVALVNSVVETSGSKDDAGEAKHTYGLRKRSSKSGRDSPNDDEEQPQPARRARKTQQPLKKRSVPTASSASSAALSKRTLPKKVGSSSAVGKHGNGPISQGLQSTQQVPNPLLQKVNPPPQRPDPAQARAASATLPPVPCPLPAGESKEASCRPVAAHSAQVSGKANESAGRRGRIFSIDIDPEGLEFPDMNIDVSMQPMHPGARIRAASIEQASQADSSKSTSVTFKPQGEHKDSLDVSLPSTGGRGRAMSFEFFSFGINADEPLPPTPVVSGTTEVAPAFQRPRGDSIIFEPDSFRDGGVLEEHALVKGRTASIDLAAPEELALMNTPGFAPAPTTVPEKPNHRHAAPPPKKASRAGAPRRSTSKSSAPTTFSHATSTPTASNKSNSSMATLPSTLNTNTSETLSHTTFQMDLLNKDGRIGIYLPEERKARIAKFHSKRKMRIWRKRIKYDCRKKLADSRPRIKGRFVKRSDMGDE